MKQPDPRSYRGPVENTGDTVCHRCCGVNPIWYVANDIWNAVVGSEGGVLCPTCFMLLANQIGVTSGVWHLVPQKSTTTE